MKIENLEDLFNHTLEDIYYAENKLVKALPKMAKACDSAALAKAFRSWLVPMVILSAVPVGLVGVVLALFLTKTAINVQSLLGVIFMVGIVVSNGVLLIDYTRVRRDQGEPLAEAVVHAGRTRLRPILMTSLATVLGLLPMAFGLGEGSEANLPLARAVIGGLLVSTALTLLLVPTLYVAAEKRLERWRKPEAEDLKVLDA